MDVIKELTNENDKLATSRDPLEVCLVNAGTVRDGCEEITMVATILEAP